mgnify:FL=1
MRKLIVSAILFALSFSVYSAKKEEQTPKLPKGAVIEQDLNVKDNLNVYKIYGSLKDIDKKRADKMRLQGKVYISPFKDYTYVSIQWLGVQKNDSPDKVVGFKEPIVSSFVFKPGTDLKNIPLPTFGDQQDLVRAINDLEEDKIDLEDLKRKRKYKAVYGDSDNSSFWLVNNKKATQLKSNQLNPSQLPKDVKDINASESLDDSVNGKGSNANRSDYGSSNSQTSFGGNGSGYTLPGFQSESNSGASTNKAPNSDNVQGLNDKHGDGLSKNNEKYYKDAETMDLFIIPGVDENNPPTQGDGVVITNTQNGKKAYLVKNGKYAKSKNGELINVPVDANTENLQTDSTGRVRRNKENNKQINQIVNSILTNLATIHEEMDFGPEISVELTEDGCSPEHDVLQERVIITARAKKIEDGKVVDEGVCEKTLESYPVKRDYMCDDCVDEVDVMNKTAYARYQEYWFNKNGERHNLGIKVDESHPFEVFEESRGCPYDIESEEGYAIKTSKIGYLNKFRLFIPVSGCEISHDSKKFKITETADGCSQLKLNGERHVQTRLTIKKDGKTIEVRECRPSDIALLQDRTPCAGQYVHDFENGKSYPLAQYYYENEGQKHYVSECQKMADYLDHQTEIKEWSHDDKNLISKPILSVYVDDEDAKISIKEKTGDNVPHEKLEDQTKPTANFHYQGCYKITRTQLFNAYRRGDGSTFEKLVGEGNPITSANLCTKSIEYQTIDNINYYRNATRYPDGHSEYDAWVQY